MKFLILGVLLTFLAASSAYALTITYERVPAGTTGEVLGTTGRIGDRVRSAHCYVNNSNNSTVTLSDGATTYEIVPNKAPTEPFEMNYPLFGS